MAVHPALVEQVDDKARALIDFKAQLSKFKPRQSVLEVAIAKSQDLDR